MPKYEFVKKFNMLDVEKVVTDDYFLTTLSETKKGGYSIRDQLNLEDAIDIFGTYFLLEHSFITEKKEYHIKAEEGILGEDDIRIFVADEKGTIVDMGYLLTIHRNGITSKHALINTSFGLRLDSSRQLIIE